MHQVGPEGCGKTKLLEFAFGKIPAVAVATIHCSAQTSAKNILEKLLQICGRPVITNHGKSISPQKSEKVVLILKNIDLPR